MSKVHNSKVVELAENYTRQKSRLDPSRSTYRGRGAENSGAGPTRPDRAQNVSEPPPGNSKTTREGIFEIGPRLLPKRAGLTDKIPNFSFLGYMTSRPFAE